MPHRRPVRKGSFGGRLDHLVEHFPDEPDQRRDEEPTNPTQADSDDRHINDRLFERTWRKARAARRTAGPAEQP